MGSACAEGKAECSALVIQVLNPSTSGDGGVHTAPKLFLKGFGTHHPQDPNTALPCPCNDTMWTELWSEGEARGVCANIHVKITLQFLMPCSICPMALLCPPCRPSLCSPQCPHNHGRPGLCSPHCPHNLGQLQGRPSLCSPHNHGQPQGTPRLCWPLESPCFRGALPEGQGKVRIFCGGFTQGWRDLGKMWLVFQNIDLEKEKGKQNKDNWKMS